MELRPDLPARRSDPTALGVFATFCVAAPFAGAVVLASSTERWLPFLEAGGVVVFVVASLVLAGLSLVPTHAASLVGGYVFGAAVGPALALIAIVGAAALGHAALGAIARPRAAALLAARPRAAAVHRALVGAGPARTATLVALIRLSPLMPFALTNLLLAAAGVRATVFLVGSVVGLAPRVVAVALAGAGLAELELGAPPSTAAWLVTGIVATLVALVVAGRAARRALARATGDQT